MMRKRVSAAIRQRVWRQAEERCGYCQSRQDYVWDKIQIEHIVPLAHGGTDDETNLWLSCGTCNLAKSDKIEAFDAESNHVVSLFNPRAQNWNEHFAWSADGTTIIGQTAIGKVTIATLKLNRPRYVSIRKLWVAAGWHPPTD